MNMMKDIKAPMEGLTRVKVASHLQKYQKSKGKTDKSIRPIKTEEPSSQECKEKIPTEPRDKPEQVAIDSLKPRDESMPGEDKPSEQTELLRFRRQDIDVAAPLQADKLMDDKPKEDASCLPIPDDTCPVDVVPKLSGALDMLSSRGDDIAHFFD